MELRIKKKFFRSLYFNQKVYTSKFIVDDQTVEFENKSINYILLCSYCYNF